MSFLNQAFIWKFFKFGVVGVTGTALDFSITFLGKEIFKWNKYVANSLGFLIASSSNFLLNRIWTFGSEDPNLMQQYMKFMMISLVGLALNNLFLYIFNDRMKYPFYPSKAAAVLIVMLWNFFGNYIYTFS